MDDPEVEHVNGNLQLNAQQARALYENAVMKDARNGDIGRVLPDDNGYKGKININIEFSARKPSGTPDSYEYQYIYMQDITEDAKYTVAALKELGIDLEALASSAIE